MLEDEGRSGHSFGLAHDRSSQFYQILSLSQFYSVFDSIHFHFLVPMTWFRAGNFRNMKRVTDELLFHKPLLDGPCLFSWSALWPGLFWLVPTCRVGIYFVLHAIVPLVPKRVWLSNALDAYSNPSGTTEIPGKKSLQFSSCHDIGLCQTQASDESCIPLT